MIKTLQRVALLLVELHPDIHRRIGSEVSKALKDISTNHIITISRFKLVSIGALCRDRIELGVPGWR